MDQHDIVPQRKSWIEFLHGDVNSLEIRDQKQAICNI